jgi:hypothetical protein
MELSEIEGVSSVVASQNDRQVRVDFSPPATEAQIADTLIEINYPPAN